MALILCMDTATKACSVSLCSDGKAIHSMARQEEGYVHAEKLHVLVQEVLEESGKGFSDLDAIAVGSGPGSYTGLRIGVSAAKGFAYGANIPLIGIPTLQIIAAAGKNSIKEDTFSMRPMIDARRMEVFSAAYDPQLSETEICQAHIIDEQSFISELNAGPVYFLGDGMEKCRKILDKHMNSRFISDIIPSAAAMGMLAEERLANSQTEDVAYFEPFYLKEYVAKKSTKTL